MDVRADPEMASSSERSARWLSEAREALVDELAQQLSLTLIRRQPDRRTLEATITAGVAAGWPLEVLGFWITALRHSGASWDDVSELLGTSRQAAHHRFARWARRYRPFLMLTFPAGRPVPASAAETRARLRDSADLGADRLDDLHDVIASLACSRLDAVAEPPPG